MAEELTHEQIKKVQALYPKIAPELNEINGLKNFMQIEQKARRKNEQYLPIY